MQKEDSRIKRGVIKDIGFIDPYCCNEYALQNIPDELEHKLLRALRKQYKKEKYYFLTISGECYRLVHFLFHLFEVKSKWWVMRAQVPPYSANHSSWRRKSRRHGLETKRTWGVGRHGRNAPEVNSNIIALYRQLSFISRYQVSNNSFIHFLYRVGYGNSSPRLFRGIGKTIWYFKNSV